MNRYVREGGRSFYENQGRYINPYGIGTPEFNDFERGWSQALKRSPESLTSDYWPRAASARRRWPMLPNLARARNEKEIPAEIFSFLESRVRERRANDPSYRPPKYAWRTKVYYIRIEAYEMPLWKIGVTSNNLVSRYCRADMQLIVPIRDWQYSTREEAEAIEREVLAEFQNDLYRGSPVLRSGGDGELFTRDVLH